MKTKRIKITQNHIAWGLTALVVICLSITFYLIFTRMPKFREQIGTVLGVLMPIILGIGMAYVLLPVYNLIFRKLKPPLERIAQKKHAASIARGVSAFVSLALMLTIVLGLLLLAVPQLAQSIISIAYAIPSNVEKLSDYVGNLLQNHPLLQEAVDDVFNTAETNLNTILRTHVIPYFTDILGIVTKGIMNIAGFLLDFVVGIIVCVYVLLNKDKFSGQAKKFVYRVFKVEKANQIIGDARKVHMVFSGFISGSIIDSLIIGLITFVALSIMRMPYVMMISVIIGLTNLIPFFGPFIGAVPSFLIVLMVDPVKSVYLLIYIVIVQQLDGNVIKPKTLGTSTGLPSFWVLFAILVGGGFFGFAGLIFGVPVFATFYMFITRWVNRGLRRKGLPYKPDIYYNLSYIDPSDLEPAERPDEEYKDDFSFYSSETMQGKGGVLTRRLRQRMEQYRTKTNAAVRAELEAAPEIVEEEESGITDKMEIGEQTEHKESGEGRENGHK